MFELYLMLACHNQTSGFDPNHLIQCIIIGFNLIDIFKDLSIIFSTHSYSYFHLIHLVQLACSLFWFW